MTLPLINSLATHAREKPDHIAYKILPSGDTVTYRELDERSNQCSHLIRAEGAQRGDVIAILMENHPRYFEVVWAADRSGLYFTCISSRLSQQEAAFIVEDSGASILFSSQKMSLLARQVAELVPGITLFIVDGLAEGARDYITEREEQSRAPVVDESQGAAMLYSSGTTGRPKGVKFPLPDAAIKSINPVTQYSIDWFGGGAGLVYLSPAPMYHAGPLSWSMCVHRVGGTVIVMEDFDAEYSLALIQSEKVTHSQWVPTHFIRMLKLPEDVRLKYDLSSHQKTFHAAAPCPVPIKEAMLQWWGLIIDEFYAGTESNGLAAIGPEEWLAHRGSVGKAAFGAIHIISDTGEELPAREQGLIYFEGGSRFSYHNDAEQTLGAYHAEGWSTLGDIGWLDEDGYLFLTDRKDFMIISGGVNIYPQEIENAIITHPQVADVAVIGAPDDDLGERLLAIVEPLNWNDIGDALVQSIQDHVLGQLSRFKSPRQIDFIEELPRHPTGKLYKRYLRDQHWAGYKDNKGDHTP